MNIMKKPHNFLILNSVAATCGLFVVYSILSAPLQDVYTQGVFTQGDMVAILLGTFNLILLCIILADLIILHKGILKPDDNDHQKV